MARKKPHGKPASTRRQQHTIKRPQQLAALASPERMRIADALSTIGPCSARDLAAQLGRAPQALYYHLKALQSAGLVEISGTQPAGRRQEAIYRLVATELKVDTKRAGSALREQLADAASALLRLADRQTKTTFASGDARLDGNDRNLTVQRITARLKPTELKQLNRKLDELIEFLAARQAETDTSEAISLTFALHPFGY